MTAEESWAWGAGAFAEIYDRIAAAGLSPAGPGEALFTDIGFTGGGKGAGMVYRAGKADHKMDNDQMVEHIVELVEARAAELEAEKAKTLQAAE